MIAILVSIVPFSFLSQLGFQVTHIVLLFLYPFSSSIRFLSYCARAFGVEGVLGRLLAYSRYGKLESLVSSRFGQCLRWLLLVWFNLSI